jgi:hypothetical protein
MRAEREKDGLIGHEFASLLCRPRNLTPAADVVLVHPVHVVPLAVD